MNSTNPYRLPLTQDYFSAYLSMPETSTGVVMSMFYVPSGERESYQRKWRDWLGSHDKRYWPEWVEPWGLHCKQQAAR